MSTSPASILVIGPSWVGDMVLAHSFFQSLKQTQPNCTIDVAAPAWTLPILERMPEVRNAIPLPFKHGELALFKRIQLGKTLSKRGYTQAILLVNSLKSAIIPFFANIPVRTGFLGEMRYGLINDIRPLDKTKLPKTVERFNALAQVKPVLSVTVNPQPILRVHKETIPALLKQFGIPSNKKILGLCPGAEYGEAKRWPAKYYAEVANAALEKGWSVLLFGSQKDQPVTAHINQLTHQRCVELGGKTSLGEAIDLMSTCDTVVSNDSGLMHVAAALNRKVIAIYGSSDPHHTPPMHPESVILSLNLSCSPCFKRICPLGHTNCLKNLNPELIIKKLNVI